MKRRSGGGGGGEPVATATTTRSGPSTRRGTSSSSSASGGDDTLTPRPGTSSSTRYGSSSQGQGAAPPGAGSSAGPSQADIDLSNYIEDGNLGLGDIPMVETDGNLDEIDTNSLFRSGPPLPRAFQSGPGASTPMDKRQIRKQYSELISYCQEQENQKEFDSNLQTLMTKNITEGGKLFKQIGGSPGVMHLAFYHTCMVSEVIKYKTMSIGNTTSSFKMDLFLNSIMTQCRGQDNQYSVKQAFKNLSCSAADCSKTAPHVVALVGAFDRAAFSAPPKEKKERVPRRKAFDEQSVQATQHEEVRITEAERVTKNKTNADNFTKEIFSLLKTQTSGRGTQTPGGINLFEFIWDTDSYASTIEHLFYIAFLIRDGDIRLYKDDSRNKSTGRSALCIKPDVRPEKEPAETRHQQHDKEKSKKARRQHILSFSAKQWREMQSGVSGVNIITEHKRLLLQQGQNANSNPKPKKK